MLMLLIQPALPGATNLLFRLSSGLQLEATVSTGPVLDNRDCLLPVMPDECTHVQLTNNLNQLILVTHPKKAPDSDLEEGPPQPLMMSFPPTVHGWFQAG